MVVASERHGNRLGVALDSLGDRFVGEGIPLESLGNRLETAGGLRGQCLGIPRKQRTEDQKQMMEDHGQLSTEHRGWKTTAAASILALVAQSKVGRWGISTWRLRRISKHPVNHSRVGTAAPPPATAKIVDALFCFQKLFRYFTRRNISYYNNEKPNFHKHKES